MAGVVNISIANERNNISKQQGLNDLVNAIVNVTTTPTNAY
jgi:ethanolamine utilization microcompartment shell protein EutS